MKDILELIRDHLGSDFVESNVYAIADAPYPKFKEFLSRAENLYWNWPKHDAEIQPFDKREVFHPLLDPPVTCFSPDAWAKQICQRLLYFPSVTVDDPLASVIHAPSVAAGMGIDSDLDKLREQVRCALLKLAALSPLTGRSEVILVPKPMIGMSKIVQQSAQNTREAIVRSTGGPEYESLRDNAILWMEFCELMKFHPVATDLEIEKVLRSSLLFNQRSPTELLAAESVVRHIIPRAKNITFDNILRLRDTEGAFYQFRSTMQSVLAEANRNTAKEPHLFTAEFQTLANDRLGEALKHVTKAIERSPFISEVFIPSGLALSTIALGFAVTGANPAAGLVATGLIPASWAMKNAIRRYNESGQRNSVLKSFYSTLIETD